MANDVVVVGAGGFGREVIDVIEAINHRSEGTWNLVGVVDDRVSDTNFERLANRGVPFLGGIDALASLSRMYYVVGVGNPAVRRVLAARVEEHGHVAATLVHPASTRGSQVEIGAGTVICAGVRLTTNIRLGAHVHLNLNATVGHDSTLGDFVSVNPPGSVSGDCVIEEGVLVGVAGVILNGLRVGAGATVGGSACVVRDVQPGQTVKGVPAR